MKPTNKNLSDFYGLSLSVIQKWKKDRPRVYEALKEMFMRVYDNKKRKIEKVD